MKDFSKEQQDIIALFYTRYRNPMLCFARKYVSNADAEDVIQDVFEKLLTNPIDANVELCIESPDALRRIIFSWVRNACINRGISINTRGKITGSNMPESNDRILADDSAEKQYLHKNMMEMVLNEIEKLTTRSRTIILSYYIEGLNTKEIAKQLNINKYETIKRYLCIALHNLKAACKNLSK
ncbi:MAG: sigma-70 family RNA polymerase sigma factor [Prevotellaceae bacterium]|jgi:RNA polymerase sigma factor (sigma-70 family)|nr:sigma-70 family RNA polymerase sigma factor [Prevotellaceae bacterium]